MNHLITLDQLESILILNKHLFDLLNIILNVYLLDQFLFLIHHLMVEENLMVYIQEFHYLFRLLMKEYNNVEYIIDL
jgi:hypothetical protein